MYDLLIIGAGIAGYTAAIRGSKEGIKTAIIESGEIGGACLNRGCIPTKYMLSEAHKYHCLNKSLELKEYTGNIYVNFEKITEVMRLKVNRMSFGIKGLLNANGIDIYNEQAEFIDERNIMLCFSKRRLEAQNIIIATGSAPRMLPVYVNEDKVENINKCRSIFTTDNIFTDLCRIPESMIILGGGAVGIEFAFMFSEFGTKVTVIEGRDTLLGNIDSDMDTALFSAMNHNNISVKLNCIIDRVVENENGAVVYDVASEVIAEAETVLVAIGRKPSYDSLRIENAGIIASPHGIETDKIYRTNTKNIFAIGDVNGRHTFAYAAAAQAINVVSYISGKRFLKDTTLIPTCIFTNPEIAFVGITAQEAKSGDNNFKTSKFLMSASGRSSADGNGGFIKLIVDDKSQVIVGGECVCYAATELISQVTIAVKNKMTLNEFSETVFPHPTYSEALGEAAELISGNCIYMLQ